MSESLKFLLFPYPSYHGRGRTEHAVLSLEYVAVQVNGVSCKVTSQVEAIHDPADESVTP